MNTFLGKRPLALAALLWLASTASWAQATDQTTPRGRWLTASGNLEVEIAPCAAPPSKPRQNALCGTVTRVIANRSMSQDGSDMKPVDGRPALGMQILSSFEPDAQGEQWQGEIYNRENGKTYSCRMSLDGQGGLVLRAYVGLPLFGKTQVWRRS